MSTPTPHPIHALAPVTSFHLTHSELIPLIIEQESVTRFKTFNWDTAWQLGSSIRDLLLERYGKDVGAGVGAVIMIELWGGHEVFKCVVGKGPEVSPSNWEWARAKSNVVRKFCKSSLRVGREIASSGKTPEDKGLHFPEYACHGGGYPLWLAGSDITPIGAILVSGLPQLEDHQLIVDAIAKVSHLLADTQSEQ